VALFNPLTFDWSDRAVVLGNLAILAGALLWAASILHIRAHRWHSTPLVLIRWETLLATVLLAPIALAAGPPTHLEWTPEFTPLLLYLRVVGTAVAYWAVATASRHLPAVTTSLGLLATPVVSAITATLWLGEPLTLHWWSRSSWCWAASRSASPTAWARTGGDLTASARGPILPPWPTTTRRPTLPLRRRRSCCGRSDRAATRSWR